MVIFRVYTIYFFRHLPLFFSHPAHHFCGGPSLSPFVLNPGCCSRFRRSYVLLNRRSTAPVYRHFVKSNAPRDLRAIKSVLNPSFGRVKPPLCPGTGGGGGGFQLTDALHALKLNKFKSTPVKEANVYRVKVWLLLERYRDCQ